MMTMRRVLPVLGLLAGLLSAPVAAGAAGSQDAEVLNRLQQLSAGIETLSSDFTQEKFLAVFKDTLASSGHFYFKKPDSLRWELTHPIATGFVLNGNRGRRWHERTGQDESFDIERDPVMKIIAQQLLDWTRADFDRLRQDYHIVVIKEQPVVLRLEPLFDSAGFLDHLLISFVPDGRHVQSVEMHEKDGDYTRIRFENTVINQPLAKDLF